ncbi:hypothetical protein [Arthrobacter sp. NEB 688]|uniref:hypothetical protein n=1 Tax=Arthrobacter sp. NEB 688 TaxID=904039 RepID=UPI0015651851|nr:hypothetical protein [Arthrobacter sp. NEB 688]QKE82892.1 hypothetical protein HL663_02280 [Arthrobacter sp. NEB 688]
MFFVIAAGLALLGLGFGLAGVSVGPNANEPVSCGSFLRPDGEAAKTEDHIDALAFGETDRDMSTACESALERRQLPTYGLLGLGALFVLGGMLTISQQTAPQRR